MSDESPFGGAGGLNGLMQKAMEMQQQVQKAQERASTKTVVGEAGGGLVRVTVNGQQQVVAVDIEAAIVDADEVEMLQDLVVAATNAALAKAKGLMADELGPLARMLEMTGVKL